MERLSTVTAVATDRDGLPCADLVQRRPGVSEWSASAELMRELPGCLVSTADDGLAVALLAAGAVERRHAHVMHLVLPASGGAEAHGRTSDFHCFTGDAQPPVPWDQVVSGYLAAYPPDHPDETPRREALVADYLVPYTTGGRLGPLITRASAIAVSQDYAYAGVLVVDRPDEGPWVCDIWRDPDPRFAGCGAQLLGWAASRLVGRLGLAVTVSNTRAVRAYQRLGFVIESTSRTMQLPRR